MVEDRAEDAELAIRELRRAALDCQTERVDEADAFRRALVEFRPDIVLADYTVPGFGGMAALEILKNDAPTIPLIVVTGSLDEETAAECIKAGAADYVLKTNLIRLEPAISGALAFFQSQADKHAAEAALRISERRFRALVEESWDAIALFGSDGAILYGSPATTRVLGYNPPGFLVIDAVEIIEPEARADRLGVMPEVICPNSALCN